jgi:hypothetical protein
MKDQKLVLWVPMVGQILGVQSVGFDMLPGATIMFAIPRHSASPRIATQHGHFLEVFFQSDEIIKRTEEKGFAWAMFSVLLDSVPRRDQAALCYLSMWQMLSGPQSA